MVKNYILDTNVLIHDPNCIFKFEDNNLIIPFPVIEEIDKLKTRSDKVAKSARDVARILDSLRDGMPLQKGVKLQNGGTLKILAIEKNDPKYKMPSYLGESKDNFILYYALYLKEVDKNFKTIIVSKDLNLRIKADALGIESQDYLSDKIDIELLPDGYIIIDNPTKHLEIKDTYTYSELGLNEEPYPNTYLKYGEKLLRYNKKKQAFEKIQMTFNSVIFGITPRSAEQVFALDALLDPDIPFVTLVGIAGTGKTLLALAAGLYNILENKVYDRLLVSKPVIPMGKDIGYIPGGIEEKMRPWLQSIYDNLDFLFKGKGKKPDEYLTKRDLLEIEVLSYIRGRTIPNQYMIVDEAQNLTPSEVKTILTRAGEGTKIVFTGDPYQIDNLYLDSSSNGLVYAASKFKGIDLAANITMKKGERSELATISAEIL
ncbi:MAG: PhoH family protein [Defluviitoga tunisiensis]|uniref:PhoH family protein n=1 Tax=Defluviitoga tunisiensis TaxID=1006576 RepID=A0A0C7P2H1_DEFTU|nr:PhoH family protein [Defluviitoga tunisiensis]MDD3601540.1 PhoH family protein [Defluviitoga tunisiensis]MDY0379604.1 PhoH family protein [Defluviitoga tunisiensis]CEP78505.1 PhoH family protein [Defluviitoga tunisiensis]HHV00686.1 PhoH family protein [Defluviitoga tunisiensis]HOB55926.1 PhoH family protein [Defluviitoga tunisiensis]